jgi:putative transposase
LKNWAEQQSIELTYIQPGNPQQYAYIERYNRTMRYEWLAVQETTAQWLWTYNKERPHMGLGGITPNKNWHYMPGLYF